MALPPKQKPSDGTLSYVALRKNGDKLSDGRRRISSLSEITGMEGDIITMQEVFRYRQTGLTASGEVLGHFEAAGIRPRFVDELNAHGVVLPNDIFRPDATFEA